MLFRSNTCVSSVNHKVRPRLADRLLQQKLPVPQTDRQTYTLSCPRQNITKTRAWRVCLVMFFPDHQPIISEPSHLPWPTEHGHKRVTYRFQMTGSQKNNIFRQGRNVFQRPTVPQRHQFINRQVYAANPDLEIGLLNNHGKTLLWGIA